MSSCTFDLFPAGALGRELVELSLVYIDQSTYTKINSDQIQIIDPRRFGESVKGLVQDIREEISRRALMYATVNDLRSKNCFPKLYGYLGLSRENDHLELVDKAMDLLIENNCSADLWRDQYTTPQFFKINYFKYAKQGFLGRITDRDYPHRYIDGFSFILAILGYFLAYVGRTREKLYLLLHSDVIPQYMMPHYREIHRLSKNIAVLARNEAPDSIIALNLALLLIERGIVRDLCTGRLLVVQVSGPRSTLLTVHDLGTHGLVRLLSGQKDLVKYIRVMLDSVSSTRWDRPDEYSSFVASIANRLLLYASTCSNEVLYSITASLRRFGDHYIQGGRLPDVAIKAAGKLKGYLESIGVKGLASYFHGFSNEVSKLVKVCPLEDVVYGF